MGSPRTSQRVRISLDVEPELRRQVRTAAAAQKLSMRDYIVASLKRSLATDEREEAATWAQVSARAFARDWDSEEDAVYDRLPPG